MRHRFSPISTFPAEMRGQKRDSRSFVRPWSLFDREISRFPSPIDTGSRGIDPPFQMKESRVSRNPMRAINPRAV